MYVHVSIKILLLSITYDIVSYVTLSYPELSFKVLDTRRPRAPLLCLSVCLFVRMCVCLSKCLSHLRSAGATKTKFGPTYLVHLQYTITLSIILNILRQSRGKIQTMGRVNLRICFCGLFYATSLR